LRVLESILVVQGSKLAFVIEGLGVGEGVGVGVGVVVGVAFGATVFMATPLFQTNFPFFFIQVYFLLAKVFCDFSFLQLEPATVF
jgi:hypothetical protein